jgi:hypothetical protein
MKIRSNSNLFEPKRGKGDQLGDQGSHKGKSAKVGNTPCAPQLREERGKVPPLHQLEPLHPKRKKVYKATTPPQHHQTISHSIPIHPPHPSHRQPPPHHPLCHFSSFPPRTPQEQQEHQEPEQEEEQEEQDQDEHGDQEKKHKALVN